MAGCRLLWNAYLATVTYSLLSPPLQHLRVTMQAHVLCVLRTGPDSQLG